jgi:cytochrome d ubiquinol oxidase subunit II
MFDFSQSVNLPIIWGLIIATAIFVYVLLDGFDLGIGILFPFAPSDKCRDRMMNSIAPFWDGNETWLVLGGGGLFAAFPLAYAILLPAFYMPIIIMSDVYGIMWSILAP